MQYSVNNKDIRTIMYKKERKTYTIISYSDVLNKAIELFNNDRDKAMAWYLEPSVLYGGKPPYLVCKKGKSRQVYRDLRKLTSLGIAKP